MQKTLVISWGMPPGLAGSCVIIYNLALQFSKEEMVLAGQDPGVDLPLDWASDKPAIHYIATPLPNGWRGDKAWRIAQVPLMIARAIRLAQRERCANILGVFPDEWFLLVAYVVSRLGKLRLFPYFHNTYLENRFGWRERLARWLQPRVFRAASHVFVMSEGMRELYNRRYPGLSCSALPHTFNETLPLETADKPLGGQLVIGFAGNVNESCVDAAPRMFRAVSTLPQARLRLFSVLPATYYAANGAPLDRTELQELPRRQVVQQLGQCDILLLPHGFTGRLSQVEYDTIFPTKTIEYLISGRPILAHTPPGVFLTRFLKEHDCALVVEEASEAALLAAIERLRTDAALRARLVANALKTARMFQAAVVAKHLRQVLEST